MLLGDRWRSPEVMRACAYHEAGHAVVSWRLGDGIDRVSIAMGLSAEGERTGGNFRRRRSGDRTIAGGWPFRHLVMLLAGAAAQRQYDARSEVVSCAAIDIRIARDFASVVSSSREAARALLLWAHMEARGRVAADWHLVEALARALLDAGTMTGDAATTLLVEAEQAHRAALAEIRLELASAAAA